MLVPAIKAALPKPSPKPGNPHATLVQDEMERLQVRGDGKPLPAGAGRTDSASPVVTPLLVPDAHDEGGDAGEEAEELEAALDESERAKTFATPETRGINDLRAEWSEEDLRLAREHGIDPWPD